MTRSLRIALVLVAAAVLAQQAAAQESKAAKYTREKLKQVIDDFDSKETGTKAFFEDVNRELTKSITFKIDGTSGISNNTKLTYKAKKVTVEKLLNDISDKYEFGWIVISDPGNNKVDGNIVIRRNAKGKERGYELGKEPKEEKKSSSLQPPLLPRTTGIALREMKAASPAHREAIESYLRNLANRQAVLPNSIFVEAPLRLARD
jgi:hypothetical protein